MVRDPFGISDQNDRIRETRCGESPLCFKNISSTIACSIWEPEPGLLMLAIHLRPPGASVTQEINLINNGNRLNGSNGAGGGHGRGLRPPEATFPQTLLKEANGQECRGSSELRIGLVLPGEHPQQRPDRLDITGLSIDPLAREVKAGEIEVSLTAREFDLLYFLARHQGHVFTRSHLLYTVWGPDFYGDESTVTVHISRLRRKLNHNTNHLDLIQTVWGVGYKFCPPNERG